MFAAVTCKSCSSSSLARSPCISRGRRITLSKVLGILVVLSDAEHWISILCLFCSLAVYTWKWDEKRTSLDSAERWNAAKAREVVALVLSLAFSGYEKTKMVPKYGARGGPTIAWTCLTNSEKGWFQDFSAITIQLGQWLAAYTFIVATPWMIPYCPRLECSCIIFCPDCGGVEVGFRILGNT